MPSIPIRGKNHHPATVSPEIPDPSCVTRLHPCGGQSAPQCTPKQWRVKWFIPTMSRKPTSLISLVCIVCMLYSRLKMGGEWRLLD